MSISNPRRWGRSLEGIAIGAMALTPLLLYAVPTAAHAATATMIDPDNGDFRIATVTGVVVGPGTYDAMFHYGTSFDSLPAPAITFDSDSSSNAVALALLAPINALAINGMAGAATRWIYIPFAVQTDGSIEARTVFCYSDSNPVFCSGDTGTGSFLPDGNVFSNQAWVTFTPVPEPPQGLGSCAALAALALVGAFRFPSRGRAVRRPWHGKDTAADGV